MTTTWTQHWRESMDGEPDKTTLLTFTAQIVAAHIARNIVAADALPTLITTVFNTLSSTGGVAEPVVEKGEPAVPIRRSVFADHIVCLDCGRHFSTLKRHLNADHGLTPETYRAKWGLPRDYLMVARTYAAKRSALAKKIGLGRKAGPSAPAARVKVTKVPEGKRGRPRKVA